MSANFVNPEEIAYFIDSVRPFQLVQIGSTRWMDVHEMIVKLSQQAVLEAMEHREEEVKEFLISRDKLKVLVHEAWCVSIWKTRVLSHLLEIDPNPEATFMIYTVLFHEAAVVSLLDMALFHGSACEMLKDSAIDLVDYCAQGVANLIGLVTMGWHENSSNVDVDGSVLTEMERQKRDVIYKIGMRCISILSYMAENAKALPLSATRRMVVTHDVPWLMADLLTFRPWERRVKKEVQHYVNDNWAKVKPEDIAKVQPSEAQAWFCLRRLLVNKELMESYDMTEERRKRLGSCNGLLHEAVLDQLPPLIEFKQFLCHFLTGSSFGGAGKKNKLLLEEVPEIYDSIMREADGEEGFLGIAKQQESIFLTKDHNEILKMADRMTQVYNTELLAELEHRPEAVGKNQSPQKEQKTMDKEEEKKEAAVPTTDEAMEAKVEDEDGVAAAAAAATAAMGSTESEGLDDKKKAKNCGKCGKAADKKCSNCRQVFYCSRQCQVNDWNNHKPTCIKLGWELPD